MSKDPKAKMPVISAWKVAGDVRRSVGFRVLALGMGRGYRRTGSHSSLYAFGA